MRRLLRWLYCRRGQHSMVPVGPETVQTDDGPWRVTGECWRCGLLEGAPDNVATTFQEQLDRMWWNREDDGSHPGRTGPDPGATAA